MIVVAIEFIASTGNEGQNKRKYRGLAITNKPLPVNKTIKPGNDSPVTGIGRSPSAAAVAVPMGETRLAARTNSASREWDFLSEPRGSAIAIICRGASFVGT
jgi:hypothetical protein